MTRALRARFSLSAAAVVAALASIVAVGAWRARAPGPVVVSPARKPAAPVRIDRHALVSRHNPVLHRLDPEAPLSVGNGEFAFTADVTGLQTFAEAYDETIPLGTLSQWGWHRSPNPGGWSIDRFPFTEFDSHGRKVGYADIPGDRRTPEVQWLRGNPHRLHLGRIGFDLRTADGRSAGPADLGDIAQTLDLWEGALISRFSFEGQPVSVETICHPARDLLAVRVRSPLVALGRLGVRLAFPYGSGQATAADWSRPEAHETVLVRTGPTSVRFDRRLDEDRYVALAAWAPNGTLAERTRHVFVLTPAAGSDTFDFAVEFRAVSPSNPAKAGSHAEAAAGTPAAVGFHGETAAGTPAEAGSHAERNPGTPAEAGSHAERNGAEGGQTGGEVAQTAGGLSVTGAARVASTVTGAATAGSPMTGVGSGFSRIPASFDETRAAARRHWSRFWLDGGAIDLSLSRDPRWRELERRIVLSQYLTAIQSAGSTPPQETGLTFNSWEGKFHLEMHWWHAAQFALWNRLPLLEKSLGFYRDILPRARAMAARQGYRGARWPKMTDPSGTESPSTVGPFLVWQQPHPIFYAELTYRERPGRATLERFREVVFETAQFMASYASWDEGAKRFVLGPPLQCAQEVFPKETTVNCAYELAYWRWGLETAQAWRERTGLPRDADWDRVLAGLSPLPVAEGKYLFAGSAPDTYQNPRWARDHPSVVAALGMLPGHAVDRDTMRRTLDWIWTHWSWPDTWGWDYPMLAMTAARLGDPGRAVDALLIDTPKNRYRANGHNHQRPGLTIYLPGNGALLYAVAMMAAGWDGGPDRPAPGFPADGSWVVRAEGLRRAP